MAVGVLPDPAADDDAAKAARRERALRLEAEQARDSAEQRAATRRLRGFVRRVDAAVPRREAPNRDRPMCAAWSDHQGSEAS